MRITATILLLFTLQLNCICQKNDAECQFEVTKQAEKLYKKGAEAIKVGNYTEATTILQQVTDESPEFLKALWSLANLNRRETNQYRDVDIAIENYNKIIDLCPSYQNFYSYYYLGKLYYEKKEWKKAHENLELFLNSETNNIQETHFDDASDLSKYADFFDKMYSNPVPFKPSIISLVSTPNDEYLPSLSPDNEYLYFTRRYREDVKSSGIKSGEEKFCSAKKTTENNFEIGEPIKSPFNEESNEGGASLTINNKELFYTRCIVTSNRNLNCDICYSKLEDNKWSKITPLGPEINNPDSWESMPSISSDGKTIYFTSDRKGGFGGYDIYTSTKDKDGNWSKAVNMGSKINTAGNEKSPFIHSDSKTLYFSSSDRYSEEEDKYYAGHMGLGGYDIFYSRLDSNNEWSEPKNIGYPINSTENDLGFFVSSNGKTGFFASSKLGYDKDKNNKEPWNIYSFNLYEEAQPEKIFFVKGTLIDEKNNNPITDAKIELKNVKTKEITNIPVDNKTGEYVFTMLKKDDYTMTIKEKDHVYETKYISQKNSKFENPTTINMELKPLEIGKPYVLNEIYFSTNSDELTEESKKVIEGFYEFLNDNPNIKIEIQGHTDNIGSDEYNIKLSESRAKTVYDFLIQKGIKSTQIKYKGYGRNFAVADNNTEEGRAKNRRTVFIILDK